MNKGKRRKPLEYADIRVAGDGAVMIAVDDASLIENEPVLIKKHKGEVFILQNGQLKVKFPVPLPDLYNSIHAENEIIVVQAQTDGNFQVFDQLLFM